MPDRRALTTRIGQSGKAIRPHAKTANTPEGLSFLISGSAAFNRMSRPASVRVGQFVVSAVARNIQANLGIRIGMWKVEPAVR
jgi:hypothetical protein